MRYEDLEKLKKGQRLWIKSWDLYGIVENLVNQDKRKIAVIKLEDGCTAYCNEEEIEKKRPSRAKDKKKSKR